MITNLAKLAGVVCDLQDACGVAVLPKLVNLLLMESQHQVLVCVVLIELRRCVLPDSAAQACLECSCSQARHHATE